MSTVIYEVRDRVAHLTLNRPQSLNALNLAMIEDLRVATARAEIDTDVRAILIAGAGEHFMAGGDLKWFREQLALPPQERGNRHGMPAGVRNRFCCATVSSRPFLARP